MYQLLQWGYRTAEQRACILILRPCIFSGSWPHVGLSINTSEYNFIHWLLPPRKHSTSPLHIWVLMLFNSNICVYFENQMKSIEGPVWASWKDIER